MEEAIATVAPTVTPFTFGVRIISRMFGWCGLNPTEEISIPPVWRQLRAETTNTGKKTILNHLLYPSNMGDKEVNIY